MSRQFVMGAATALGIVMAIQDWYGLEGSIQHARDHWTDLPWWVGASIAAWSAWLGRSPADTGVALREEVERLRAAAEKVIEMNRFTALHKYGDADKAETWACVRTLRDVLPPNALAQRTGAEGDRSGAA